jgi:predicted transcriptional regulator
MTKDKLSEILITKYGSQKQAAIVFGISESALSALLKKPSKKFLIKLKREGITVEGDITQTHSGTGSNIQSDNSSITLNDIGVYQERVKALENEIKRLEQIIMAKDETIQAYKNKNK